MSEWTLHSYFQDQRRPNEAIASVTPTQGEKLWIAEELTSNQLKNKSQELKKMREAREQGKWAVFRGGNAIIQEFRTPKPAPPPPLTSP